MFVIVSQVFAVVLAVIAISKSYVEFRKKREPLRIFLLWSVTWGVIVLVAIFPQIVDYIILEFGGGRAGLGTFFGMGLVFLFFVVYRMYVKLDHVEQKLHQVVQELSLKDD